MLVAEQYHSSTTAIPRQFDVVAVRCGLRLAAGLDRERHIAASLVTRRTASRGGNTRAGRHGVEATLGWNHNARGYKKRDTGRATGATGEEAEGEAVRREGEGTLG